MSSSGESDTSEPDAKRAKLTCLWCKEDHACQWLLLVDIGDWQGSLSAICYDCYMTSEEHGKDTLTSRVQFKAAATKRWTLRKKKAGTHASVARGIEFTRAIQVIGERHLTQNKVVWKAEVKCQIRTVGKLCQRTYNKLDERDKRRFVVAFQEMEENLSKIAETPMFIPQYHTEVYDKEDAPAGFEYQVHSQAVVQKSLFWAAEGALDWSSQLMEGLDNYYLCRNIDCRAFMPNTCWVKEGGYDHYRCPMCTREYQPWSCAKTTNILPNKLLVGSCNGDDDMAREMEMAAQEVRVWFVIWADTPESVLQRRMQEINLKLEEETRNMSSKELAELVHDKVNATSARIFFGQKCMPKTSITEIERLNTETNRKWEYKHLLKGFLGACAPPYIKGQTPYYDNDDAITMWGYSRHLVQKQKFEKK